MTININLRPGHTPMCFICGASRWDPPTQIGRVRSWWWWRRHFRTHYRRRYCWPINNWVRR